MDKDKIIAAIKEKVNLPDDVIEKAGGLLEGQNFVGRANKDDIIKLLVEKLMVLILIIAGIVRHSIDNEFHYEGWIDCMPPLDSAEAELCERAERAGYEKIAY